MSADLIFHPYVLYAIPYFIAAIVLCVAKLAERRKTAVEKRKEYIAYFPATANEPEAPKKSRMTQMFARIKTRRAA